MADAAASPARDQALALLDKLCRDSLEIPLSVARAYPDHDDISHTFAWLADLIEANINA